ncbi:acyl carrier protein [Aureliella helgolandensis]|uniref:Acyl carrier protein n=1 Tax=Aureliella helgolandensis TaxID=2527968 RepID=A0A518G3E1_9BACT|nr:Acyl carrier protein [Aureliella helgolandensis]
MGLDVVELVMEIEEAFGISLPDDRAGKMLTVGDVYEFILEKTADTTLKSSTCLTAAAFYQLRRHLRSLGLPHSKVRPKTKLERAIPLLGRRSYWLTLSSRMDLQFPRLGRPSWLALVNCMLVAIVVSASFLGFAQQGVLVGIFAAVVSGVICSAILMFLTSPFAIYPASNCVTIRDLVTNLVAINYNTLATRYSTRNPTDVWTALQLIVVEQLGVDRNAVVPHARFIQDLGAD